MTALSEIDQLIVNKAYLEAMTLLEGVDASSLDGDDLGYYLILLGECSLELGRVPLPNVDEAIEIFRYGANTVLFARAKQIKGRELSSLGKFTEGKEHLIEAYAGFLRCREHRRAGAAINMLAFVETHVGTYETASQSLSRCATLLDESSDTGTSLVPRMNLAYISIVAGRLHDSLEQHQQVLQNVTSLSARNSAAFYANFALADALLGNYGMATKRLDETSSKLPEFPREHAVALEVYGKLETLRGNLTKAEKHLSEGLKLSLKIAPESTLVSQTKRLLADVYVAKNDYDRAKTLAEEALAVATKINERLEIAACHRVFGQVDSHRGEYDSAREWFRKAIDVLAMIGAQYELAVTRFDAAVSHAFSQKESVALLFLAKEYFVREQVKPYLDKTDRALHALTAQQSKPEPARPAKKAPVVISQSRAMNAILEKIEYVAPSNMNILLLGETGTGKDLIASWIHHVSGRSGEFVSVNAAALPEHLFESELFGSRRGAFTGAESDRTGLLEQAAGGTFYLNEIAETTPAVQAKLLEVIESKRVRRLGENDQRAVDFRLIAATNRDLAARVQANEFRADLYHRLNEIPITLPSLRARIEDIPSMLTYFLQLSGADGQLTRRRADIARLAKTLASRIWPGNVRELQSEVRRLWMESRGDVDRMLELVQSGRTDTERREMLELLDACGGNRREMARRLNVSDSTIRYRLHKLGIDIPEPVTGEF
ncbi:sigma 54-interacting transcriptional regulator [bacterium]|nr:sigma 54-interacting transcriptional regulator [bacterium]